MVKFDVIMSTYNGQEFLTQQLESILSQTEYINRLIIRDDGSTDDTFKILRSYQKDYPEIVEILEDKGGNLGTKDSFMFATSKSTSQWICFCDQDDVWHESKLSQISELIRSKNIDSTTSCVVFSDLEVVDQNLNLIHKSFFKYSNIKFKQLNVIELLIAGKVPGCAMAFNRVAYESSKKFLKLFNYHDAAVIFACVESGEFYSLKNPLLKYRQHGKNQVGIKDQNIKISKRVISFFKESIYINTKKLKNKIDLVLNTKNIPQLINLDTFFRSKLFSSKKFGYIFCEKVSLRFKIRLIISLIIDNCRI